MFKYVFRYYFVPVFCYNLGVITHDQTSLIDMGPDGVTEASAKAVVNTIRMPLNFIWKIIDDF